MKADVTKLVWIEVDEPAIQSRQRTIDNGRGATRVTAGLPLAIGTRGHAYFARSADISESGLLVSLDDQSTLEVWNRVRVLIKGIVSDSDSQKQVFSMTVSRVEGNQTALTFRD